MFRAQHHGKVKYTPWAQAAFHGAHNPLATISPLSVFQHTMSSNLFMNVMHINGWKLPVGSKIHGQSN